MAFDQLQFPLRQLHLATKLCPFWKCLRYHESGGMSAINATGLVVVTTTPAGDRRTNTLGRSHLLLVVDFPGLPATPVQSTYMHFPVI